MNLPLVFGFSTLSLFAVAAAGETDIDLDGREQEVGDIPSRFSLQKVLRTPDWCGTGRDEFAAMIAKYEASVPKDPTYKEARSFASDLAMFGRSAKARELFLHAEQLKPGDADLALGLAQCSEDLDDLPAAVMWAERAMERQPVDAGYTWLYLRIIRAKAGARQDRDWLKKGGALGLDFGNAPRPSVEPSFPKEIFPDLQTLLSALERNLAHRAPYVDSARGWKVPPHADPFAGELLLDLGNILALFGAVQTAIPWYELAQTLQAPRSELVRARLAYARGVVSQQSTGISGAKPGRLR